MVPFIYIPSYGQVKLGMSRSLSLYTIVVAQAVSIFGRLLAAFVASRIGVMIPWLTCGTISAIMCLAWAGIHDVASFFAYAALYGMSTCSSRSLFTKTLNSFLLQVDSVALSFRYHQVYSRSFVLIRKFWGLVSEWPKRSVPRPL